MKTTLKEIKNFYAKDITYIGFEDMNKLRNEENGFEIIAKSFGMYGVTGLVIRGLKSKEMFKICSRTSAIFMV